jgi:hypothetical protein
VSPRKNRVRAKYFILSASPTGFEPCYRRESPKTSR